MSKSTRIQRHFQFSAFDCHPDIQYVLQCPAPNWSVDDAWNVDWFMHDVPNKFLITDPTIRQPGFDLNRNDWTLLVMAVVQLFCTTGANETIRSVGKQTMLHIINECPLTKHPGGLQTFHIADEDSITWLVFLFLYSAIFYRSIKLGLPACVCV